MSKFITTTIGFALTVVALGTATTVMPARGAGQGGGAAATVAGLPEELKRAAIASRSDRRGLIAGARIGDTGIYVVYIKTDRGCGSGGCRAQIWKRDVARFVRMGSTPVGRLPIVMLPRTEQGMLLIGVTVFDQASAKLAILPFVLDGTSVTQRPSGRLLPAGSGKVLLAQSMLRPF